MVDREVAAHVDVAEHEEVGAEGRRVADREVAQERDVAVHEQVAGERGRGADEQVAVELDVLRRAHRPDDVERVGGVGRVEADLAAAERVEADAHELLGAREEGVVRPDGLDGLHERERRQRPAAEVGGRRMTSADAPVVGGRGVGRGERPARRVEEHDRRQALGGPVGHDRVERPEVERHGRSDASDPDVPRAVHDERVGVDAEQQVGCGREDVAVELDHVDLRVGLAREPDVSHGDRDARDDDAEGDETLGGPGRRDVVPEAGQAGRGEHGALGERLGGLADDRPRRAAGAVGRGRRPEHDEVLRDVVEVVAGDEDEARDEGAGRHVELEPLADDDVGAHAAHEVGRLRLRRGGGREAGRVVVGAGRGDPRGLRRHVREALGGRAPRRARLIHARGRDRVGRPGHGVDPGVLERRGRQHGVGGRLRGRVVRQLSAAAAVDARAHGDAAADGELAGRLHERRDVAPPVGHEGHRGRAGEHELVRAGDRDRGAVAAPDVGHEGVVGRELPQQVGRRRADADAEQQAHDGRGVGRDVGERQPGRDAGDVVGAVVLVGQREVAGRGRHVAREEGRILDLGEEALEDVDACGHRRAESLEPRGRGREVRALHAAVGRLGEGHHAGRRQEVRRDRQVAVGDRGHGPADGEAASEGEAAADHQVSRELEGPADGEVARDGQRAADGRRADRREPAADGEAPAGGQRAAKGARACDA